MNDEKIEKMEKGKLLPCPFCDNEPYTEQEKDYSIIQCQEVNCVNPWIEANDDETFADISVVWNTRADSNLLAENERLKQILDRDNPVIREVVNNLLEELDCLNLTYALAKVRVLKSELEKRDEILKRIYQNHSASLDWSDSGFVVNQIIEENNDVFLKAYLGEELFNLSKTSGSSVAESVGEGKE